MLVRFIAVILLCALSGAAWYAYVRFQIDGLDRLAYSCIAVTASYIVLKILLEELASRRVRDPRARYSFRKTTQLLFVVVSFIVILRIWIPNPQALLVAYGLIGAGVAISLQDVFKNFAGSVSIFLGGIYRVGDRIEVDSMFGDVIDIGLFYTTLIELREWVDGDQTTGRITVLPNWYGLSHAVHNYTKDHGFIWDEIELPVTHGSDWKGLIEQIKPVVHHLTGEMVERAKKEVPRLEQKYFLSRRSFEPEVFVDLTDNWTTLRIRYVVSVKERRAVRNLLYQALLKLLENNPDVSIGSQTLTVSTPARPGQPPAGTSEPVDDSGVTSRKGKESAE